jgi:hypothetical protein
MSSKSLSVLNLFEFVNGFLRLLMSLLRYLGCLKNKFLWPKITSSNVPAIIWEGTSNALLIYFFFVKKIVLHLLKEKQLVNPGTRAWAIIYTGLGFLKPNRAGPPRLNPRALGFFFNFFKRG